MNHQLSSKAFTLVETLVSLGIIAVITLAITAFERDIFSLNSSLQNNLTAQLDARKVLRTAIAELRSASPSSSGAYPLAQVGTSSLIFYSNIDGDAPKEKLRYFLQNSTLMRGVTEPTGVPIVYNPSVEKLDIVIRNVVSSASTPIFEYFDKNFYGTTTPLTQPVDPLAVRLVRITVVIDRDPNRSPTNITVTTQGTLRNLKDNL